MLEAIRNKVLFLCTVTGYMWVGWLCAMDATWYWIITVLLITSIAHIANVHFEAKRRNND